MIQVSAHTSDQSVLFALFRGLLVIDTLTDSRRTASKQQSSSGQIPFVFILKSHLQSFKNSHLKFLAFDWSSTDVQHQVSYPIICYLFVIKQSALLYFLESATLLSSASSLYSKSLLLLTIKYANHSTSTSSMLGSKISPVCA